MIECGNDVQSLRVAQSAIKKICCVYLDPDGEGRSDGRPNLIDDLDDDLHTGTDRSAIHIIPPVEERRQELAEEEPVGRVNLYAPEAAFLRQASRMRKSARQGGDLFRVERGAGQPWKIKRARPFWRANRWIGQRTGMAKLKPKMAAPLSTLPRQPGARPK